MESRKDLNRGMVSMLEGAGASLGQFSESRKTEEETADMRLV